MHKGALFLAATVMLAVIGRSAVAQSPVTPSQLPTSSVLDSVIRQSPAERTATAAAMSQEIDKLTKNLSVLTAGPKSPIAVAKIAEINSALSAKQQARDAIYGSTDNLSPAATEAFASITSPFFLICGDQLWAPSSDPLEWATQLHKVQPALIAVARSVGLVMLGEQPIGSAMVVSKTYVLTNLHVAKDIADQQPDKSWKLRAQAKIIFDREFPIGAAQGCAMPRQERSYHINAIFNVPENGDDLAVLLTGVDESYPDGVKFSRRPVQSYVANMSVGVIGYPGPPSDMTEVEQKEYFHTPSTTAPVFAYKRISEGDTDFRPVSNAGVFSHKANTTPGNSGSAIVDLADGTVVGVHFQGYDRFKNNMGYNQGIISERVLGDLKSAAVPVSLAERSAADNDAACVGGEWKEAAADNLHWNFQVDAAGTLTISRMDQFVSGTFDKDGNSWKGNLKWGNGDAWTNVILTPNSDCSALKTNQRWSYKRS